MSNPFNIMMRQKQKQPKTVKKSPDPSLSPCSSIRQRVPCPICGRTIPLDHINFHLDEHALKGTSHEKNTTPASKSPQTSATALHIQPNDTIYTEANSCVMEKHGSTKRTHDSVEDPVPNNLNQPLPSSKQPGPMANEQPYSPHEKITHGPTPITPLQASKIRGKRPKTGTVHDWFGGVDYSAPGFFVLDWPKAAYFSREIPLKSDGFTRLQKGMKWEKKELLFYFKMNETDGKPQGEQSFQVDNSGPYTASSIPLLKSHLQKCVRRSQTDKAVKTAKHLLELDQCQLLRRLPLIMIEDCALHSSFPTLVWMMAASAKGFVLPRAMIAWIFGVVAFISKSKARELPGHESPLTTPMQKIWKELKTSEFQNLMFSLQLRRSFGGMKGDMAMLDFATKKWLERLRHCEELQNQTLETNESLKIGHVKLFAKCIGNMAEVVPIPPTNVASLKLTEWELSAVDFHITDIAAIIAAKCDVQVEDLKSAMWACSSSITNKGVWFFSTKPVDPTPTSAALWNKCENTFKQVAPTVLRSHVSKTLLT
eukprot:m.105986 g.105986  ORF g.105986 m.105986 type:complete len:539 (-) comp27694_c0_seq3:497-2113(-)